MTDERFRVLRPRWASARVWLPQAGTQRYTMTLSRPSLLSLLRWTTLDRERKRLVPRGAELAQVTADGEQWIAGSELFGGLLSPWRLSKPIGPFTTVELTFFARCEVQLFIGWELIQSFTLSELAEQKEAT